MWKHLAPYAHCSEPLKIHQYVIALLAPLVLVEILHAILGIVLGNAIITLFRIILSGGATWDLMIYKLIKKDPPVVYVQNHPSEAGCWIFRKN